MGMPSGIELFAIVAVIALLFGGKKIPELAKGLGQGIKNFKCALKEDKPEAMANTGKKAEEDKVSESKSTENYKKTTV